MKYGLDYMLQVMQAAKEGKEIERSQKGYEKWGLYVVESNNWNWQHFDYRIKPEEPKLEYVPYESAEEFLQAQKEHGESYIMDRTLKRYVLVCCLTPSFVTIVDSNGRGFRRYYDELLNNFTFLDGTPCGKLIK